jgi:ABC-type transport system involved in cytochrome c biogenesis permease subunit
MFTPRALKIAAILAMALSVIGLLLSLLLVGKSGSFIMGIVSWSLLIWASYIGFQLSSYKLYEDEYKKVGFRIYAIIAAFIAFLTFGFIIGMILAVVLLASLWGLKKNYDEWVNSPPLEDPNTESV